MSSIIRKLVEDAAADGLHLIVVSEECEEYRGTDANEAYEIIMDLEMAVLSVVNEASDKKDNSGSVLLIPGHEGLEQIVDFGGRWMERWYAAMSRFA